MVSIHAENLGDLAVVECQGRIVHSDSVFKLRDVVQAQSDARVIALDLSGVRAISGGGLGMLALLARWAEQHDIRLKLFAPSASVLEGLAQTRSIMKFEIASFREMVNLVAQSEIAQSDHSYSIAA